MTGMKPIIADPMRLYSFGLRNLMDMVILVHIGRCGLVGARRTSIAEMLGVSYHTARSGVDRLQEHRLITVISRDHGPGLAYSMVVTLKGWKLLTQPADFSLFPHSQLALKNYDRQKKTTPAPEKADNAPAIHAILDDDGDGNRHRGEDSGARAEAKWPPALGSQDEGGENRPSTGTAERPYGAGMEESSGDRGVLSEVLLGRAALG